MSKRTKNIKLRIGGVPEHFNLPWRLSIESGSLKQYAVDATWTDFYSGTGQMVKALNNNEVDIATLLTEGAIKALANQDSEFEIFSFYTKSPLIWGVHVPPQTDIHSLDDLNKATFAISRYGSGSNLMAYLLAEAQGLDTTSLKFEIIDNLDGARALYKKGGNYVFLWEKFMTKPFVDNGEMRRITDFPTPWSCFVTCVRKDILKQYPDTLENIMQDVLKTANQLKRSKLATKLIASQYQLDIADVETWLESTKWAKKPKLNSDVLQTIKEKLISLKLIT